MRDEIELKKYLTALLKGWKVLIALTVLAGAASFGTIKFQTPLYTSTASIYVGPPNNSMEFDVRMISTAAKSIDYKAALEIVGSKEFQQEALNSVAGKYSIDIDEFQNNSESGNGTSPSTIRLSVTLADRQAAADLANAWAEVAADRLNAIAGGTDPDTISALEKQKEKAEQAVYEAASALATFEKENNISFLEQDIQALLEKRAALLQANPAEVPDLLSQRKDTEAQIIRSQQSLLEIKARKDLLEQYYNRALQTHEILNTKINELEVSIAIGNTFARIFDHATVLKSPNQQKWETVTAMSAAAGFMIGVLIIIIKLWWHEDLSDTSSRA